ncbi:hypothetical protein P3X46_034044 [Hevea brasiliensis]|uniref:GDSL esterase/lipase 1-like n=1 Tax=Hevea brasiliensis TaxID=3981 RepID=A0ABQ9K905_HEVBR|nr:hypothetical protein P3X46_034044 [Hevea brasiliensis]
MKYGLQLNMAKTLSSHIYVLVFCSSLLISTYCQTDLWSPENSVASFIFGDSLFDAGNNNYIKNASFRADYPTGRFSDGQLIPDFIAEWLKLPLLPPYLQPGNHDYVYGVNFASAGAGAPVETRQGTVCNDYVVYVASNSTVFQSSSKEDYVEIVIGNLTSVIKEIWTCKYRSYGCAPFTRGLNTSGGCLEEVTALIKLHNRALSKVLEDLQKELKGFEYSVLDFYTSLSKRMNKPSKYGFKVRKVACCGSGPFRGILDSGVKHEYELCDDPTEYLFFDSAHLTEKAYNQLGKLFGSGSPDVTWPYNLKTLLKA